MAEPLPTFDAGVPDPTPPPEQQPAAPAVAATAPRRRRWHQFSLRTLLGLVVLAAIGLTAWRLVMEPYWTYRAERSAMALVEKLGGSYQTKAAPNWAQRIFGSDAANLTLVNLADCDQPGEYLKHVAGLTCLETLAVGGPEFRDEQLAELRPLRTLCWLVLDCTGVSDEALAELQQTLPDLQVYRSQRRVIAAVRAAKGVVSTKPNGEHQDLRQLLAAEFFEEADQAFTRRGAPEISALRTLTEFAPIDPILGDAELSQLRSLRNLTRVALPNRTTDAGLVHLIDLKGITSLSLERITDAGMRHVGALTGLKHLHILDTRVTDAGLAELADLKDLETIALWGGARISGNGLARLAGNKDLKRLYLGCSVTDADLAPLAAFEKLEKLVLMQVPINGSGLAHLPVSLEVLNLMESLVTDPGLASLQRLKNLKELALADTDVTDKALVHAAGLTKLVELGLTDTGVSDAGLVHLQALSSLGMLYLNGTFVTDRGLPYLYGLKNLRRVDLFRTNVTEGGAAKLQAALPNCQVYHESMRRAPRKPGPTKKVATGGKVAAETASGP